MARGLPRACCPLPPWTKDLLGTLWEDCPVPSAQSPLTSLDPSASAQPTLAPRDPQAYTEGSQEEFFTEGRPLSGS